MASIALTAIALMPGASPLARAQSETPRYPLVTEYSPAATGSSNLSFRIAQDENGVIYFAGTSLLTFDGDHWTRAAPIPDSFAIRSLRFGPDGRLWIAAMGDIGWFERGADPQWQYHSLRAKLPEPDSLAEAWDVYPDETGTTFVTEDQVLRWDGERFATWTMPGSRRLYSCTADGVVFVYYQPDGLYIVDRGGPRLFIARAVLGDAAVLWADRQGDGWLLGTGDGFFFYDGVRLTRFAPEITEFIRENKLCGAVRLPDARIAVATMTGGIVFLLPGGEVDYHLNTENGLPSNFATSLFVTRDAELWATSIMHIVRIDDRPHTTIFNERRGLPRQAQRNIARFGDRLAVGNENGLYLLSRDETEFAPVESLKGSWQHFLPDSAGLVISGYRGTRLWDGESVKPLYTAHQETFYAQRSRSSPGGWWFAANRTIVALDAGGSSRVVVQDVRDNPVSFAEDAAGRLWVGTLARGLVVAAPVPGAAVTATPPAPSFGLPKLVGRTHVRGSRDGTLLVIADNGGWIKPAGASRFSRIEEYTARSGTVVSASLRDGSVWIALPNTATHAPVVGRVSIAERSARWEPHAIDALADIGAPQAIFAEVGEGGLTTVWIGGGESLLKHVVSATVLNPKPRAPLLRGFVHPAGDDAREPLQTDVPYSAGSIAFELAAPDYTRRPLLRLETRIDGVDRDWIPLGRSSTRELSAVREGNYTIRARAVAETGLASEESSFTFQVLPAWWRTSHAYAAYALAIASLIYSAYRLRVRALARRNVALEAKVRQRTEELEAASAAKTEFVANMSHDIRNPLNGIVGLALALEDGRLDGRQREIVSTLRECTTYLSSLVDDVLDFASIEAGRVELRPAPFAPEELLRSVITTLKADTAECSATLTFEIDRRLPANLLGDPGRIQQILVNFVSNALKYAGGTIHLSATCPVDAPGEVEFAVADAGPGVSPEEQATLFTKFTRLQRNQREDIPGAGLGLAACRLLADIMGGSVGVTSSAGHGSRFFLRLPITVATAPAEAPAADLPNTTVLLVEDTDYNAWAASAVLARLGLTCDRARTGEEALRMFGQKRYNVVLLDRNLPDMDGTKVARRIRSMETDGSQSLLLAVTAYCTAEDRALCLEAGMDAFVGKPLTPDKLRRVLLAAGEKLLAGATVDVPRAAPAAELDLSLLGFLGGGSDEGVAQQIRGFLERLAETEAAIESAVSAGDFAAAGAQAHEMLSHARMVGGAKLGETASRLEAAAASGERDACRERLRAMRSEVRAITEAMRQRLPLAQPS